MRASLHERDPTAVLTASVWLLVASCCSGSSPSTPDPPTHSVELRLQAQVDEWSAQASHRGVSAAVIFADGSEWLGAAGVESQAIDLRTEHLIWIASITKTMTGAIILQLAEEGALGLDDAVSDWLSALPNVNANITVRQLLNHTNGLANYTSSSALDAAIEEDATRVFSALELLDFVGPKAFDPGERTQYTNTAFVLLGLIAEAVTGKSITALYHERLWDPLGLTEVFLPGFEPAPGPVAAAWAGTGAAEEVAPLEHLSLLSIGNSAFGLFSNARTVARWGRALFAGSLLGDAMRAQMLDLVSAAGNIPGESGAGLGIRAYEFLGREQWGHSGGSPLGSSLLIFDEVSGTTVAVIMNQGRGAEHFLLAPRLLEIATEP